MIDDIPVRTGTDQYIFTFSHWIVKGTSTKATSSTQITADMELEAVFTNSLRKYHVSVKICDTTGNIFYGINLVDNQLVAYGSTVNLAGYDNLSEFYYVDEENHYRYEWVEWGSTGDPRSTLITSDTVFYAKATATYIGNTVTFKTAKGDQKFVFNTGSKLKTIPYNSEIQNSLYNFRGWKDSATGLKVTDETITM